MTIDADLILAIVSRSNAKRVGFTMKRKEIFENGGKRAVFTRTKEHSADLVERKMEVLLAFRNFESFRSHLKMRAVPVQSCRIHGVALFHVNERDLWGA